jgi:hypothetical protein
MTPVAEKPGAWQVYVVDERFTLVAAVRQFDDSHADLSPADGQADPGAPGDHKSARHGESKETARGVERLVCWGLAMPARENAWTLYVFRESAVASKSQSGLPSVPLPQGAQRNLSIRDERGGQLLGFSGSGSAQIWMEFYDDWFARQGWSKTDKWSTGAEAWSARFTPPSASQAGWIEIRIAADRNGDLTGLIQIQ